LEGWSGEEASPSAILTVEELMARPRQLTDPWAQTPDSRLSRSRGRVRTPGGEKLSEPPTVGLGTLWFVDPAA